MFSHEDNFHDFRLNREKKDHILAHCTRKCKDYNEDCKPDDKDIWVSKNMGQKWEKILNRAIEATWFDIILT